MLKTIKSIRPTTASGVDFIDNRTLKLVAEEITPALIHIINLSISTNSFPSVYKWSKVTPLLKKNTLDPILPSSYRPVNQLVSISKIVERVVFFYTQTNMGEGQAIALQPHSSKCTINGWKT